MFLELVYWFLFYCMHTVVFVFVRCFLGVCVCVVVLLRVCVVFIVEVSLLLCFGL